MYKFLAYKGTDSEILTAEDLIRHCEVDGICKKRFDFINKYIASHNTGRSFIGENPIWGAEVSLDSVYKDLLFLKILLDKNFSEEWSKNENDTAGK
jgi:hypothetical protein